MKNPIPKEHPEEDTKTCPNCDSPLVIRDEVWICFTCVHEEPVARAILLGDSMGDNKRY